MPQKVQMDVQKLDLVKDKSATNMYNMFYRDEKLESLDLSTWDVSSVENMGSMFYSCKKLKSLDLSTWDVGNVINFGSFCSFCSGTFFSSFFMTFISFVSSFDFVLNRFLNEGEEVNG